MPRPSLIQRGNFKAYIRYFKDKFNSNIQKLPQYWVDLMLSSKAAGITTNTDVNFIIFDNKDTVAITTAFSNNNELIYIPALSGDKITLRVGSSRFTLEFGSEGGPITYDGTSYGLNDTIPVNVSGNNLIVKGLGGALLQSTPAPSYSIGVSTTSVNEGGSVNFTVNATAISAGTTVYYSTTGTTNAADFADGSLTGSFNIVGTGATTGVATITRSLASDTASESQETFNLQIREGSTSGTVVATSPIITVNSVDSYYTITPSATSVNEGSSVSFTVNTAGVSTSQPLYYSTGGTATAEDFSNNSTTGSFTVVSTGATTGTGTIVRSIATDAVLDGDETFNISVRVGSESGTIVATSSDVTIGDVAPTYSITPDVLNVDEGGSVVFTATSTLSTQTLYYTVTSPNNALTDADFISSPTSGSLNITNGSAQIVLYLNSDRSTEGPEKFSVELRSGSTTGTILATSSEVTINDTSLSVGANANGLTFGPIRVNRDDGQIANASDWYDICSLDQIPEGGKVAIFVDTSGSMTMGTVSQSYNKLVEKLQEKNITIITVTNSNEDWILPFLTDLS